MITGKTKLIAHLGYPTESFRAPMIYNPYFEKHGIDAVVVPMGCRSEDYPGFLRLRLPALQHPRRADHHAAQGHDGRAARRGDRPTAKVAGSCNAVRLGPERQAGRRHVRRRGLRARRAAQGPRAAGRARAGGRQRRRRLGDRRVAGEGRRRASSRSSTRTAPTMEGLARPPARPLSEPEGHDRLERSRRASTSSSTPRRSA